jgi:glycosyltransferase involved in cell wall biosynthesis
MAGRPDISVVICTYNRRALLSSALNSLLQQRSPGLDYEIIVVDNNSPPDTQALVEELMQTDARLRYLQETRQGNAYARNTGVENARAPIVAFIDDDCTVRDDWIETINNAFTDDSVDFVGGKVLPRWETTPPSWLTNAHWAPIAAVDYGNTRFSITSHNPVCLLTANIAFRQNIFEKFGGFSPDLQRSGDSIGSLEDHEYLTRLVRGGAAGLYIPEMVVDAFVGRERMTKSYHRRWHRGHGYFYAVMNDPEWERSKVRLAGVPGHLYKQTVTHAVTWCSKVLTGHADAAFESECGLRFFYGFFLARQNPVGKTSP